MLSEWFSITRTIGLTSYTVALAAVLMRWIRSSKTGASGRTFALLAGVQFALLLDMAFDWRWHVHEYWMRQAIAHGFYGERRNPQLLFLVALLILCALCVVLLLRSRRNIGWQLAVTGTMLSVALWCSEAVSYHYLDRMLYARLGGAMLVSFLWCGLAALTCLGLWLDEKNSQAEFRD